MADLVGLLVPENPEDSRERKKSTSGSLIELAHAGCAEFFHDAEGDGFARLRVENHVESWPIRSRGFRSWLSGQFYGATGGAPNSQAFEEALRVLEAKAMFEGAEQKVHVRVAADSGKLYLDLADCSWRAVRIVPGAWRILDHSPIPFRRARGMLSLPEPIPGGPVEELWPFLNLRDEDAWRLLVSWLSFTLRPEGPFPVLMLHGEQGAAKSTTARVLRHLVDPNRAELRGEPKDLRDVAIAADNGWLVVFDNLSSLPVWLSDAICRLATGGGYATRLLYSDKDEALFDAIRPVIITGIEEVATRGDLLDRALILNLEPITEDRRREECSFWASFEAKQSALLGALLDVVAKTMAIWPEVQLTRWPRMADFARWGAAVETALRWPPGSFAAAYARNRGEAHQAALDASPVAGALQKLMETKSSWEGEAADLKEALDNEADEKIQRDRNWPKSPRGFSGALRRVAPALRAIGLGVTFDREPTKDRRRVIRIVRAEGRGAQPSEPSEPSETLDFSVSKAGRSSDAKLDSTVQPSDNRPTAKPCGAGTPDDTDDSDAKSRILSGEFLSN